jgi:hypothetical protein
MVLYVLDHPTVECSKDLSNGGDLPFYSSEALTECVEALVQVDRVAVGSR